MNPLLDYFNRKDKPSLILLNPSLVPVGSLGQAYNVITDLRFSAISSLSFSYPMSIDNGVTKTEAYDNIKVKMVIELEGVGRYIISECPETSDGSIPIKNVVAQSMESEMLYKRITALSGTFPFYDSLNPQGSIIGKVLKLLPEWSVGTIDEELVEMHRTFDVGDNTIYNFLTSDVANAFGCLFTFNSFGKTIDATLIKNLEDHSGGFMSLDNTNRSISVTEFSDEICTAMNCYGGTDLDIHSVNPIGGNTIYNFDYYINDTSNNWITDGLRFDLSKWRIKLKENTQLYRDTTLANNIAIAEYTNIKQLIVEYQSSLDALQVTLEGLQAIPISTEDAEARATRLAEIEKTNNDIANTQIAIRKARSDKAAKRQEIDENFSELRVITSTLRFTNQQTWQALADDTFEIIGKFAEVADDWKSVIFETADDLEIDIPQFSSAIPSIEEDISSITYEMQALYEDVSAKLLQYWNLEDSHKEYVISSINILVEKIRSLCYKFDNLISNLDMTIELRSDAEKLFSYTEVIGEPDNLSKSESDELEHFIFYNTYTNNNIITTDIMTEEEIQEQALMLYDQAVEVLKRSSNPRYELSGDFISIINAPEFHDLVQSLDLGKQVTIELPDGSHHTDITLLEMSYNYDAPDSFTMTFSNRIKLNTSNFKFADMFLGLTGGDNTGLSGITNGSESKAGSISQSQSLSGTNLLSVTNALISKLGFVSFGPTPPTKYGNYVGSWFGYDKGAKLSLYSSSTDYMQWTGDKLLIKAKNFTLDSNGNITANNADLSGKITAASGYIGGWKIEPDYLSSGEGNSTVILNSSGMGAPAISAGAADAASAPFRVMNDGSMFATDANISGCIVAETGKIGGWNVNDNSLYAESIALHSGSPAIIIGDATDYDSGVGIFLGKDVLDNTYKMRIGNPSRDYLAWTGKELNVAGYIRSTDQPFELELMKMSFQSISWAQFAIFDGFENEYKRAQPDPSTYKAEIVQGTLTSGDDVTPNRSFGFYSKIYEDITTVYSHTSTAVGAGYLQDTNGDWFADQYRGYILKDSAGTEFDIINCALGYLYVSGNPQAGSYSIMSDLPTTTVLFCSFLDASNGGAGYTKVELSFNNQGNFQTLLDTETGLNYVGGMVSITNPGRDYSFRITLKNSPSGNSPILHKILACTDPSVWQ